MKKRIIKIVVLIAVFILAVLGFSAYINQGEADMTADMDAATLPTLVFQYGDVQANSLVGHKQEMNISSIRDSILPCRGEAISGTLNAYDNIIEVLEYEICSLDGKQQLTSGKVQLDGEEFQIAVGDVLEPETEVLLKIVLQLENGEPLYFYTRIIKDTVCYANENVEYLLSLHDAIISKTETAALKKGMEPSAEGDNTTLQHVTIHSDMNHVLWGDLSPEIVSRVELEIKEVNKSYLSAQLTYRVACEGDNNDSEIYNVKEFFKVAHKDGNHYLLSYDRTATEVFDPENVVLSSKGIILGITDETIPYKVNKEGTVAAFVVERALWTYNMAEDEFSLVFGFVSPENKDTRNYYDQHGVRILSLEENGNMTFSVYGYMNRGNHEGESGLAIYYYNMSTNSIEEKAFIKSNESCLVIEEELNRLAYFNAAENILYILVEDELQKINLADGSQESLVKNLQKGQYITSDEGHMIGYQNQADGNTMTVWNFAQDKQMTVEVDEQEIAVPLGFVGEDFVYGIARPEDQGFDSANQSVQAMYKIEIRNDENTIVKTYEIDGIYVLRAEVKDNMIILKRGSKSEDRYQDVDDDYITNNEEASGVVSLKSYWTDLKQTQYRLLFDEGISNTKTKTLQPKYTLYETILTFDSTKEEESAYYMVYACGEQVGRFKNAADAVELADELAGVVISPEQRYVWEDGNRVSWYRNFNIGRFVADSGENTLEACIRRVLVYEGAEEIDVVSAMQTKSPEEILSACTSGEGVRFSGCSSKDMCYLIDKGTPVIAMKSGTEAVMLIGYDAVTVTYIDVDSGSIKNCSMEKMDEMTANSGNTYIGYVK